VTRRASNNPIQLSVCVVTPRACARVAPTQPATDRVRSAVMRSAFLLAMLLLLHGCWCQYNPYAHTFTTDKPRTEDVVGRYVLEWQTVVTGKTSTMQGKACEVVLAADGTYSATNVPPFRFEGPGATLPNALVSGSGTWRIETVGTVDTGFGEPKEYWGVRLGSLDNPLTFAAFTGRKPPYGMIFTIGDPDTGTVMRLRKNLEP